MNEIDQLIRDALGPEDGELYEKCGDQSIQEMVMDSFRGRTKWLVGMTLVGITVFFVLSIVAGIQFVRADNTHDMIVWALALLLCLMVVGMMKIWYWMELNKNAVLREVKRVELQIACLAQRGGRDTADKDCVSSD